MTRDSSPQDGGDDTRRGLIPVYAVLEEPRILELIAEFSRPLVVDAIKAALDEFRRAFRPGAALPAMDEVVERVRHVVIDEEKDRLRPVVNATGVILHTGLGRAVLPPRAAAALASLDRCCSMQIDIETGKRGKRSYMTERLLTRLTGAEAAMITNNNAAATLLILSALCTGKEVIVSHGQLIEIGGSFRLPDCIRQSGAIAVPVGTTNRTHLRDYEEALCERTGAILRANPSNYRVVGFAKEVSIAELVGLKKKRQVIVIDDVGCGALVDTERYGLPKELTVQESIAAGADVVCFSGDKLIGGPQAGIVVGRAELIARIKKHPFARMMRVCKLTDLALEQTLRLFLDEETLLENHPTLRMLAADPAALRRKAQRLKKRIDADRLPLQLRVKEDESAAGGGSMPATPLKTYVLAVQSAVHSSDRLSQLLRRNEPPVITRISEAEVIIDMRTLLDGEEKLVHEALRRVARAES